MIECLIFNQHHPLATKGLTGRPAPLRTGRLGLTRPCTQVATPSGATLEMHGSLLQLRGSAPSRSPLLDPATGSLLCFNGEVFGGLPVCPGANDAQALFCALTQATSSPMEVLSRVQGPWALVYWHAPSGTLWFGRDATGEGPLGIACYTHSPATSGRPTFSSACIDATTCLS